ncbi:MAG TPA: FtsK/SpoIIIE domain-containing protein [Trebonia sp.]|jgi:energy-coupling factor transporter ATP-binding protein EcfA2|nr:FtsK/SpoIIIE domain-containing protein [Trebonia sp.]
MLDEQRTAVGQLIQTVESCREEIARQRVRLRAAWLSANREIERVQAQIRAADATISRREKATDELMERFDAVPDDRTDYVVPTVDGGNWFQSDGVADWVVKPEIEQRLDAEFATAQRKFQDARQKTFSGGLRRVGQEALGRHEAWLQQLMEVRSALTADLERVTAARALAAAEERNRADDALAAADKLSRASLGQLPPSCQPWNSPLWNVWEPQPTIPGLDRVYAGRFAVLSDGDLGDNAAFGSTLELPYFLSLKQNLEIVYDTGTREQALSFARSLLLRQLTLFEPGEMQFCFFDPVGLGQSAAELLDLAEYDAGLIGGKVWSSAGDLADRLADQTSHIELAIQKYLRATYTTIDEFNAAAGETAEPYRQLVFFDFPASFSDESAARLQSILQNGPRCGVYTLLLTNRSVAPAYGVDLNQRSGHVRRINLGADFAEQHRGYTLQLRLRPEIESANTGTVAKRIIDAIGRRSAGRAEASVTFEKAFGLFTAAAGRGIRPELSAAAAATVAGDETTWWRDDSISGIAAPLGQRGARDAATLTFDSRDHAGALLVGRPGSGKSTLLHTLIGGLATLYGPDELELYLIDFKEGVEFKSYAEEGLPHARVVAIESDREFGLSVLQSLEAEMSRRGELLRATGGRHTSLQALREASPTPLPRVLLVFDEFQVLFARNDKVGLAAADLLETIIRQGRGFGIHVMLGSQSLSGLDALGAHVPQLLPTRILLPASELDGRRVLGDHNDAGQYLTSHGEGILNAAGGAVEANERFKGALLAEPDRIQRLRELRAKADRLGFARRPVVFEGNASTPLDDIPPLVFCEELRAGPSVVRLRAGAPMTIAGTADIELRRSAGANVLAVLRDGGESSLQAASGLAYGLLTAAVASAVQTAAQIDVIDFMPVDDGLDEVFQPLLRRERFTVQRRRAFGPLVNSLLLDVRSRVEQDDMLRPPRIAYLFGIHRARELDADICSLDADPELAAALEEVMRDGPEAGVHVWIWSDTVSGATRRLSPRMMRECSWRLAGKMSPDDSLSLLGNEEAAAIRDRQLVLSNDDLGIVTRAVTFGLPSAAWLMGILEGSAHLGTGGSAWTGTSEWENADA